MRERGKLERNEGKKMREGAASKISLYGYDPHLLISLLLEAKKERMTEYSRSEMTCDLQEIIFQSNKKNKKRRNRKRETCKDKEQGKGKVIGVHSSRWIIQMVFNKNVIKFFFLLLPRNIFSPSLLASSFDHLCVRAITRSYSLLQKK